MLFGNNNRNDRDSQNNGSQKGKVTLEGCLRETEDNMCQKGHGYRADSCWFCATGTEPTSAEENTSSFDTMRTKTHNL